MDEKDSSDQFPWLDLDRYEVMRDAPLRLWADAIYRRCVLRFYLRVGENDDSVMVDRTPMEIFDDLFVEAVKCQEDKSMNKFPGKFPHASVRPITEARLADKWENVTFFYPEANSPPMGEVPEPLLYFDDDFYETLLEVDLVAPDKVLEKEFKIIVQKLKQKLMLSSPKFGTAARAKWHRNKVLPYIDIRLYAERHNITITQQQIGWMLWPNDYDVPLDRIRRTVKPLANQLMAHYEAIRAQSYSKRE